MTLEEWGMNKSRDFMYSYNKSIIRFTESGNAYTDDSGLDHTRPVVEVFQGALPPDLKDFDKGFEVFKPTEAI